MEKNLSRLAADWRNRISMTIEELRTEAERYAKNELATLEQMLAQTNTNELQLRDAIADLNAASSRLQSAGLPPEAGLGQSRTNKSQCK